MVLATHIVCYWTGGDGGIGAASAKSISLPGDLDITALDACYRISLADAVRRIYSNDRRASPVSAQIKCATMGGRAFPDGVIADPASDF